MFSSVYYWLYYWPLRWAPFRLLSIVMGLLAKRSTPYWLIQGVIKAYVRHYKIDTTMFEPGPFSSFNSFFSRAVLPDERPLSTYSKAILSPCDGTLIHCAQIKDGSLLQVKKHRYSLAALLGEAEDSERVTCYEGGWSCTLYLSPRDYHRFHSPCDANIIRWRSIAGSLWSVSSPAYQGVPNLFARNARLITYLQSQQHPHMPPIAFVAVGAAIVSSIQMVYGKTHKSHSALSPLVAEGIFPKPIQVQRGQQLGHFELGSSIVLVFPKDYAHFHSFPPHAIVRMGQEIGEVIAA